MRIGLFGGSFNPAHQGHLYISNLAIKKLGLNQIWWIPTAHNPLKDKSIYAPFKSRLLACKKITKNHPKIRVKNFEKDSVISFKLVKKILAKYSRSHFVWVMGADNLEQFHKWDHFKKLLKSIEFAVFSRGKFLLKARSSRCHKVYQQLTRNKNIPKFSFFKTQNYDISSTQIRNSR
jgi:nicotinate-nucleotide adenylyltransferase